MEDFKKYFWNYLRSLYRKVWFLIVIVFCGIYAVYVIYVCPYINPLYCPAILSPIIPDILFILAFLIANFLIFKDQLKKTEGLEAKIKEYEDNTPKVTLAFENESREMTVRPVFFVKKESKKEIKNEEKVKHYNLDKEEPGDQKEDSILSDEAIAGVTAPLNAFREIQKTVINNIKLFSGLNSSIVQMYAKQEESRRKFENEHKNWEKEIQKYSAVQFVAACIRSQIPTENLDIYLDFPEDFVPSGELPDEPEAPQTFPNFPGKYLLPPPNFKIHNWRRVNNRRVRLHMDHFKHGGEYKFDAIYVFTDNPNARKVEIPYEITADNLRKSIKGHLTFDIQPIINEEE